MAQMWEVVGGVDKGGVLVRVGKDIGSAAEAQRLSTGALVEELGLEGERLHYRRVSGSGPKEGWLSVRLPGKDLAVRVPRKLAEADGADGTAGSAPDGAKGAPGTPPPALSPALRALFGLAGERAPIEVVDIPEGTALHVATISDIHIDHKQNMAWFQGHLPRKGAQGCYNVLILPGDVSDDLSKLRQTLEMFTGSFDLVCYTSGNHDVWVSRAGSPPDSMAKFREVLQVCADCNVRTRPVRLRMTGETGGPDVLLVPLLSFYTSDWDREPDMPWTPEEQMAMKSWTDFKAIKWPQELVDEVRRRNGEFAFASGRVSPAISEIFAAINEPWLEEVLSSSPGGAGGDSCVVLSYSHYLPRQELFPEKRFLVDGNLHKVSGSLILESQVRRLRPHLHIFGHTHLTIDLELEGQRYLQWALGTPQEQRAMTRAVGDTGMLVVYDSGGSAPHLAPVQTTFWGRFFAKGLRNPAETCPAAFVRGLFKRMYPQVELPFDDAYFLKTPNPGPPPDTWEGLYEPRWRM